MLSTPATRSQVGRACTCLTLVATLTLECSSQIDPVDDGAVVDFEVDDHFTRAMLAYDAQAWGEAAQHFGLCVDDERLRFRASWCRGWCRYMLGQYEGAVDDLRRAADLAPGDGRVHADLWRAAFLAGDLEQAETAFVDAISRGVYGRDERRFCWLGDDPLAGADELVARHRDHPIAYVNRGNTHVDRFFFDASSDRRRALADFERALELRPAFVPALVLAAEHHEDHGDLETAAGLYRRASEGLPECGWLAEREAHCLSQLGRIADGNASVSRAVETSRPHAGLLSDRAFQLVLDGRADEAAALFRRAVALDAEQRHFMWPARLETKFTVPKGAPPAAVNDIKRTYGMALDHPATLLHRVDQSRPGDALVALLRANGFRRAWNVLDSAMSRYETVADGDGPLSAVAAVLAGELLEARGDRDAARARYRQAVDGDPTWAFARRQLARLTTESGDWSGAVEAWTAYLELVDDDAEAFALRAHARSGQGDVSRAFVDCGRVFGLEPRYAYASHLRGSLRTKSGDAAGALLDLERSLQIQMTQAPVLDRGRAYLELDRRDEALADFFLVFTTGPDSSFGRDARAEIEAAGAGVELCDVCAGDGRDRPCDLCPGTGWRLLPDRKMPCDRCDRGKLRCERCGGRGWLLSR